MKAIVVLLLHIGLLHAFCVKIPCDGVAQPYHITLMMFIEQEYAKLNVAIERLEQEYQRNLQVVKEHQEKLKKLEALYKEQNLNTHEILFLQKQFNQLLSNQIERRSNEESMDSSSIE